MSGGSDEMGKGEVELVAKKTCARCNESFPLDEFYANKLSKDGHQARCKSCSGSRRRQPKPEFFEPEPDAESPRKPYSYRGVTGGMLLAGYIKSS